MIRPCNNGDFEVICEIINDSAQAYKGVIADDCWKEPYMPADELRSEINDGILFSGYETDGKLVGVMGIQHFDDVSLIRHSYVMTAYRNRGVGGELLKHLQGQSDKPLLIGTWADAVWAVQFYEKHGFELVSTEEKDRLLKKYWNIPERQTETSVVLADRKWVELNY